MVRLPGRLADRLAGAPIMAALLELAPPPAPSVIASSGLRAPMGPESSTSMSYEVLHASTHAR